MAAAAFAISACMNYCAPRTLAIGGALVAASGNAATALATSTTELILCRVIAGLGAGIVAASINCSIARSADPVTLTARANTPLILFSALYFLLIPSVYVHISYPAYFVAYGVMILLCIPPLIMLDDAEPVASKEVCHSSKYSRASGFVLLAGTFLIWLAYTAVWSFSERKGAALGMPPQRIGEVFSLALVIGLIGAYASAKIGNRFGVVVPLVSGGLVMGFCYLGVAAAGSAVVFSWTMCLFGIALFVFMPYLMGFASELDRSGGLAGAVGGVMPVAASAGPVAGGFIIESWSMATLGAVSLAAAVLFCAAVLWASRYRNPDRWRYSGNPGN